LNQSGVTVTVEMMFDCGSDILEANVQADKTNVKPNKINVRRNNLHHHSRQAKAYG
jgi:hypothetical protein